MFFYKYAHYFESLDESKNEIEKLLNDGIRSIGWDLSLNVENGIKNRHPDPERDYATAEFESAKNIQPTCRLFAAVELTSKF